MLDEHTVDLWSCRDEQVIEPSLLAYCHAQLNEVETAQQRRFYFERHRHQYLVCRAMVRSILSLYDPHVLPREWTFSTNAHGKPCISGPVAPPVRFNLSHTSGMIVVAVTQRTEIGVDVESRTRGSDLASIGEHFFSPREVEGFRSLAGEDQRRRFYELWTLKEAYIKARGLGLALPLDGFSFDFPSPHDVDITFGPAIRDDAARWRFWLLKPNDEHTLAVALAADSGADQFHVQIREFVPPAASTMVEWPCLRASAAVRQLI